MTVIAPRAAPHLAIPAGGLLVPGMPEEQYHAHPALSASGAKKLLPPSCPAIFKWEQDHGQAHRAAFDFGHAAHAAVLGIGAELAIIDADDWRTKAAKEARDAAYADGKTPLLAAEKAQVDAMAAAIAEHPIAAALLDPDRGQPEASLFWRDDRHGIDRRGRLDWLPDSDGGRLVVADYKTTVSAEPSAFARSAFNFGYDMQAVYYMDAVRALGLAEDVTFVFIAQEKTAPYVITVYELDSYSLRVGRERVDQACSTFRDCTESGVWPGYSSDIEVIAPPAWLASQYGLDDMDLVI